VPQHCKENEARVSVDIQHDFEESIGYWVTISALAFRKALNEDLAPHGITFRQSQVLGWLVLEGELSQSELAARMEVEAPTLAGLISRMEAAGLVARHSCPNDGRRKIIRIEEAAKPVWEKIAECARRLRAAATAGLSEEQVRQLLDWLRVVHENLSQRSLAVSDSV